MYIFLFILGIFFQFGVAQFQAAPGYMDAEYYASGGLQLVQGYGFWEPFRWNYLDQLGTLPHPSHTYWMPLASILASFGMQLLGNESFTAARLPFIILASSVAPTTAWLTYSITKRKNAALLAGLLAIFSGYYLPYLPTTDTFAASMLLGILIVQTTWLIIQNKYYGYRLKTLYLGLGILTGLMHLARTDGIIWLVVSGGLILFVSIQRKFEEDKLIKPDINATVLKYPYLRSFPFAILLVIIGYMLVMSPWYIRNLQVYGSIFPSGHQHAFWLTNYDELFSFDITLLSFQRWLSTGIGAILSARWDAFLINSQRVVAEQGSVILLPFMLIGMWRLRHDVRIRISGIIWVITFFLMTLLFPFAGSRGGLFHSMATIQPILWACVPLGLDAFSEWGVKFRDWKFERAWGMFGVALVGLAFLVSGIFYYKRVIGSSIIYPEWNTGWRRYIEIGQVIEQHGFNLTDIGMVNNPPGFFWATGRPSVVIPDGDISTLLEAADLYGASYLILEKDHAAGLSDLYENPTNVGNIYYLISNNDTYIFKIQ
jgi:hypothetical protein